MWSSNNFGEFIPIWDWAPLVVGLFILGLDFGVVTFIRVVVERKLYFGRWWTFKIGDVLGLPVYAGFAASVINGHEFSGFYTQWYTHLGILVFGYAFWTWVQVQNLKSGFETWEDMKVPSEAYHTFIFGIMFYLLASVFVPLVVSAEWSTSGILAFAGLAVYIGCFAVDQTSLVDKSKPFSFDREGGQKIEESSQSGQALAEYGLFLALIAVVCIIALIGLFEGIPWLIDQF